MAEFKVTRFFFVYLCVLAFLAVASKGTTTYSTEFTKAIEAVHKEISSIKNATGKVELMYHVIKVEKMVCSGGFTQHGKSRIATMLYEALVQTSLVEFSEIIINMGSLSLYLGPLHYKEMTISSLESVVTIQKVEERTLLSLGIQKYIFERFISELPPKSWSRSTAKMLSSLSQSILDHSALINMQKEEIGNLVYAMKDMHWDCSRRYLLIERYLYLHRNDHFSTTLKSMGNALCYLSLRKLKASPLDSVKTVKDVRDLCSGNWSELQARTILPLVNKVASFGDLTSLSCEHQKLLGNCWRGVSNKVFQHIAITRKNFMCFKDIILPLRLRKILTVKIKKALSKEIAASRKMPDPRQRSKITPLSSYEKRVLALVNPEEEDFVDLINYKQEDYFELLGRLIKKGLKKISLALKLSHGIDKKGKDQLFRIAKLPPNVISRMDYKSTMDVTGNFYQFDTVNLGLKKASSAGLLMPLVVVDKLKSKYGNIDKDEFTWTALFARMGPFLCGFTLAEIAIQSDAQFFEFVSEARLFAASCPEMENGVQRRFKRYFATTKSKHLTLSHVFMLREFLPSIPYDILLKIEDKNETRNAAVGYLQGACIAGRFPLWRRKVLTEIALAMLNIKSGNDLTTDHIQTLGCLTQYMKLSIWEQCSFQVMATSAYMLGQFDLSRDVRIEFMSKIEKFYGSLNRAKGLFQMHPEEFRAYYSIIWPVITEYDIRAFHKNVIIRNYDILSQAQFNVPIARQVLLIIENSLNDKREEGSTNPIDLSEKSLTDIMEMGNLLIALTPNEIKTIDDDVFKEVIEFIGSREGLSKEQWEAWGFVAKRALSGFSNLTADDVLELHNIILGIDESILRPGFSVQRILSEYIAVYDEIPSNLTKACNPVYRPKCMSNIISIYGCLLHPELTPVWNLTARRSQAEMYDTNARICITSMGEGKRYSKERILNLIEINKLLNGPVNTWKSYTILDAGVAINGFNAADLQSIKPEDFSVVKPAAINQMPTDIFKNLKASQILAMNAAQISAVTVTQMRSLNEEKMIAFTAASSYGQHPNVTVLLKFTKAEEMIAKQSSGAANLDRTVALTALTTFLSYLLLFV